MSMFVCDICDEEFNSLDDYIAHLQKHKTDADRIERERRAKAIKGNQILSEIKDDAAYLQRKIENFSKSFPDYEINFNFSVNTPTINKSKVNKSSSLEDILLDAIEKTPEAKDDTFKSFMNRVDNNIDKSKFSEKETKEYNSLKSMVEFLDKLF